MFCCVSDSWSTNFLWKYNGSILTNNTVEWLTNYAQKVPANVVPKNIWFWFLIQFSSLFLLVLAIHASKWEKLFYSHLAFFLVQNCISVWNIHKMTFFIIFLKITDIRIWVHQNQIAFKVNRFDIFWVIIYYYLTNTHPYLNYWKSAQNRKFQFTSWKLCYFYKKEKKALFIF